MRAGGGRFREEQQTYEWGQSVYKHDGARYSLGLEYDWSVDSIVGVSIDMIDSKLKSLHDDDSRENRIQGYRASANYKGSLFGMLPFDAKAFFGWTDHDGSGLVAQPGTWAPYPWKEDSHRSTVYGVSGKVGLPLLFLDSLKVLPEAGVRYTTMTTKSYNVDIGDMGAMPILIPQQTSTSVSVPISVTAKMDFPRIWGIVTPRIGGGVEMEFDKTATGVHVMNSAAASRINITQDPFTGKYMISPIRFDPAHRLLLNFNLGIDMKTVGGWEVSAEYARKWVSTYTRDDFKLEIGRCF